MENITNDVYQVPVNQPVFVPEKPKANYLVIALVLGVFALFLFGAYVLGKQSVMINNVTKSNVVVEEVKNIDMEIPSNWRVWKTKNDFELKYPNDESFILNEDFDSNGWHLVAFVNSKPYFEITNFEQYIDVLDDDNRRSVSIGDNMFNYYNKPSFRGSYLYVLNKQIKINTYEIDKYVSDQLFRQILSSIKFITPIAVNLADSAKETCQREGFSWNTKYNECTGGGSVDDYYKLKSICTGFKGKFSPQDSSCRHVNISDLTPCGPETVSVCYLNN